jgi:hypothetical protein
MGLISEMLANAGFGGTAPVDALRRRGVREFKAIIARGDMVLSSAMTAIDEVQSMAVYAPQATGGTFTLTITFANGETTTTAVIVFGASAATIETAIDVAATAEPITGWTNGDITVAGGALDTAPVTFTFDGTLVTETNMPLVVADGALLTPTADSDGAITVTTEGQADRPGWDILTEHSIIAGTIPAEGVTPTGLTAGGNLPGSSLGLSNESIKMVAAYIADLENNPLTYDAILTAVGIS